MTTRWPEVQVSGRRALTILAFVLAVTTASAASEASQRPEVPQPSAGAPVVAEAGAPLLTLDEAVAIALEGSDRLVIADADVAKAEAGLEGAHAPRLPSIDLVETVGGTTNPATSFAWLLGQEAFTQDDFDVDRLNRPDTLTNFNTTLALHQSIWTGGRIDSGVESARLLVGASELGRERTRQSVVRDVVAAYGAAVLAGNESLVAAEALETARADVALIADLREAGLVVESDLLRAKVHETEMRELVVRAESALEVARASLNHVLGRDLGTPFRLAEALSTPAAEEADLDTLIAEAVSRRPDLGAARLQTEVADQQVRRSRAGDRFEVGLTGLWEANAEDFIGADGTNWSLLVGARFRLYDGAGRRSGIRAAEADSLKARASLGLLERGVELEVRQAAADLRAATLRLEQTAEAVEMAREGLRIVRDRYQEGLATLVELLEAETALTRARARDVRAHRDALIARADLDLSVGRL